jgi:periplasmic protein TonB
MEQPTHDLRPFQASTVQGTERRAISIGIVALIHVLAIYALATGLARQLVNKGEEIIKAEIVKEKPPEQPKTPPPPPPEMTKPPPPFIPPPDINIQTTAPTTAIQNVTTITPPPVVAPPKPQAPPVSAATLASGSGNTCLSRYYPALAMRLNHEGATLVNVHIGADGSVSGVDVAQSSGHDELDEASVKCITNGWRFKPATQNGQPVASTKPYRIVWKLSGG